MKLLKSQCNDFPEYYAEYCINDLGNTGVYNFAGEWWRKAKMPGHASEGRYFRVESLEKDLIENLIANHKKDPHLRIVQKKSARVESVMM